MSEGVYSVVTTGVALAAAVVCGFAGFLAFFGEGLDEPPIEVVKVIKLPIPRLVRSVP